MADRKLSQNEKPGTFIQHYMNGDTGIIQSANIRGYYVKWFGGRRAFLPYNRINEYVVIE